MEILLLFDRHNDEKDNCVLKNQRCICAIQKFCDIFFFFFNCNGDFLGRLSICFVINFAFWGLLLPMQVSFVTLSTCSTLRLKKYIIISNCSLFDKLKLTIISLLNSDYYSSYVAPLPWVLVGRF